MIQQPPASETAIDFNAITVAQLIGHVNTLVPGTLNQRLVKHWREMWGRRVANADGTFNFFRLVAAVRLHWEERVEQKPFNRAAYVQQQKKIALAQARDIGEIPAVTDTGLRTACDSDLITFCSTAFPDIFSLAFSDAHKELIGEIQRLIETGGHKAYACERGFGKTQISVAACMWGALTGRISYSMIVGANSEMATAQRDGIRRRLETSVPLLNLYPEICYPMRVLSGSTKQTATYRGNLLRIKSRPDLILPYMPGAPGSEAVISCTGIDSGSIRGRNYDRVDGSNVRPQLVMLDDPQDDATARQPKEVASRSKKIRQAIQGVAGPGAKLAILMPCTVIVKHDLAYEFTDRTQRPEYAGVRVAAMPRMPDDLRAENPRWIEYDELRREDLAGGDKARTRATEFYKDHRAEMTAGCEVTWASRIEPGAIDAIQGLMDRYLSDRLSFLAEQQQDPQGEDDLSIYLDQRGIASRFNGMRRGVIPPQATIVTTGIDVQEHLLYFARSAWSPDMTGWLYQWGTFPKQPSQDFHHLAPPRTLRAWIRSEYPRQQFTWEETLQMAIRALNKQLDAEPLAIPEGPRLIDWRWHKSRKPIAAVALEEKFAGLLIPAGGVAVGGNDNPISSRPMPLKSHRVGPDVEWYWKREPGEPKGVLFDANFFRSQFQKALATEPGSPGSLTYNGTVEDTVLASHLAAKAVRLSVDTKREIEIWQNKPGRDQDHWLDCAIMTRVGAEVDGLRTPGNKIAPKRQRKKLTQADIGLKKRGR